MSAPPAEALTAIPIISIVGLFVLFILLVTSLPSLIGGIGLYQNQNWGRIIIIIVSIFNLFNFPFGSILAVYSLFVLLSAESNYQFNAPTPPPGQYN